MIVCNARRAPQPMITNRFTPWRYFCFVSLPCFVCLPMFAAQTKDSATHASKTLTPQAAAAAPNKSVRPRNVAPQPLLPPVVHDFSSLLESPTKGATPAQLKNITAFVSSDKGHSYSATVQTL